MNDGIEGKLSRQRHELIDKLSRERQRFTIQRVSSREVTAVLAQFADVLTQAGFDGVKLETHPDVDVLSFSMPPPFDDPYGDDTSHRRFRLYHAHREYALKLITLPLELVKTVELDSLWVAPSDGTLRFSSRTLLGHLGDVVGSFFYNTEVQIVVRATEALQDPVAEVGRDREGRYYISVARTPHGEALVARFPRGHFQGARLVLEDVKRDSPPPLV
jgi:hypothetical protein